MQLGDERFKLFGAFLHGGAMLVPQHHEQAHVQPGHRVFERLQHGRVNHLAGGAHGEHIAKSRVENDLRWHTRIRAAEHHGIRVLRVDEAQMAGLDSSDEYEQVHIARTIEHLVTHSDVIREALAQEKLMIVGARYRLESGLVEVLSF